MRARCAALYLTMNEMLRIQRDRTVRKNAVQSAYSDRYRARRHRANPRAVSSRLALVFAESSDAMEALATST